MLSGWFWAALILTVVVFSLLVKLGFWQWERGVEKQDIESMLVERAQQLPAQLSELDIPTAAATGNTDDPQYDYYAFLGFPVLANLQPEPILFYLDNQTVDGKVGYLVYQLMRDSVGRRILIELGFAPVVGSRDVLPFVSPFTGNKKVRGRLYQKQPNPLGNMLYLETLSTLQEVKAGVYTYHRIQNLNLADLAEWLSQPLLSWVIQPTDGSTGNVHPWKPISMNSNKHFGYSMQWFSMAVVFALIMLVVVRRMFKSSRKEAL
ncbi:SURF1 family protein [Vibrio methylphosphonaticus]|uniref:SURF1 family protein n=1 Tax=Vibrio methylphosphonaticus TaxID=2946866 RepID=UPI00202A5425|nr:SURF1 family protein [Vibrio methylphosphonaticus]MCL9773689.1 SURF1 family protein [Vibrio methylphosphonaticus]